MSIVEIRVPSPGESITEVEIANWLKSNGDYVELDEDICEVDSDKATLGLPSDAAGTIEILVEAGTTVRVGDVVAKIDTSAAKPEGSAKPAAPAPVAETKAVAPKEAPKVEATPAKASHATGHAGPAT